MHKFLKCGKKDPGHLWRSLVQTLAVAECRMSTGSPSSVCSSTASDCSGPYQMSYSPPGHMSFGDEPLNFSGRFAPSSTGSSPTSDPASPDWKRNFQSMMGTNLMSCLNQDEQAAQVENFYSKLGKTKDGFVCYYCGKRHSRKYGLKIHIR